MAFKNLLRSSVIIAGTLPIAVTANYLSAAENQTEIEQPSIYEKGFENNYALAENSSNEYIDAQSSYKTKQSVSSMYVRSRRWSGWGIFGKWIVTSEYTGTFHVSFTAKNKWFSTAKIESTGTPFLRLNNSSSRGYANGYNGSKILSNSFSNILVVYHKSKMYVGTWTLSGSWVTDGWSVSGWAKSY